MDPNTAEQLSRLLDGDLEAADEERLRARLAAEPALAAELESLRRLQQQVQAVADRMEPPASLDATLLPLQRTAAAPPRRIPPAVRWLGLAAGVALAVTVAVEVSRRPPGPLRPATGRLPAPQETPHQPYQLRPLPTSTIPEEERPLGAVDRLLASPPAEAPLPEPEPLDVRGPLNEGEMTGAKIGAKAAAGPATRLAETPAPRGLSAQRRVPPSADEADAAAPGTGHLELQSNARETGRRERVKQQAAVEAWLVLLLSDGSRAAALALPPEAHAVSLPLVVTVSGGVIAGIEAAHGGSPGEDALRSIRDAVAGRPVPGLADGRYRATVEPGGP